MKKPYRKWTSKAATIMLTAMPRALNRPSKPTIRNRPLKNSAAIASTASGAGMPRF